jgi:hypothetical protein
MASPRERTSSGIQFLVARKDLSRHRIKAFGQEDGPKSGGGESGDARPEIRGLCCKGLRQGEKEAMHQNRRVIFHHAFGAIYLFPFLSSFAGRQSLADTGSSCPLSHQRSKVDADPVGSCILAACSCGRGDLGHRSASFGSVLSLYSLWKATLV